MKTLAVMIKGGKKRESKTAQVVNHQKKRNLKPRCIAIRLKTADEVAKEGERPVLTERGEDVPIATPEVTTVTTGDVETPFEREVVEASDALLAEEIKAGERAEGGENKRIEGIYASEANEASEISIRDGEDEITIARRSRNNER